MKKLILLTVFVSGCSYKPIVDTAGRSGTFDLNKANEITNDLQHCRFIADANSGFISNTIHALFDPDSETKYKVLYRNCLKQRGHSVLN